MNLLLFLVGIKLYKHTNTTATSGIKRVREEEQRKSALCWLDG